MPARRQNPNSALDEMWVELITEMQAAALGFERLLVARLGSGGANRLRLLTLLGAGGKNGGTPTELAAWLGVSRSRVSRLVSAFVAEGLVELGDYRGDGRCRSVWITEAGTAAQIALRDKLSQDVLGLEQMVPVDRASHVIAVAKGMRKTLTTWRAHCARGPRRKPTWW